MGLYEELSQTFPLEDVHPYGFVVIVPKEVFKAEWESQLKSEGVQIYTNSYNGRMCFFLRRKAESQSRSEPQAPLKPFEWTGENLELVKRLRSEGLSFRAIERRLRELGFKIHHITIARKLKALEETSQPKSSTPENVENPEDGLFRELMEASQMLYPRFKRACALLLREASRILEQS